MDYLQLKSEALNIKLKSDLLMTYLVKLQVYDIKVKNHASAILGTLISDMTSSAVSF